MNRGRPRDRKLICAAILVCVVGVAVVSALTLSYLHRQAQARVASTTQNLARSLVQTFDGLLDAIDIALLASADEIAWQSASGDPDQARINTFLRTQQQRLPVMPYLRATNASGDVVHGDGVQPPYINLADRPSFISLRDQVVAGLYIGAPGPSRVNHLWAWPVSRRITEADGSFGGMVYAALTVGQIGRVMDRIRLNDGASITLRNAGFEAVAARVGAGGGRRPDLGDTRLSPELQAALARDRRSGTYVTSASVLASTPQTFSYERSEKYGFYVWVGEDNDVAMAGWQRQFQLICGLAVAFALLAVGLLLLLGRVWRRQERDVGAIERLAYYDALTGLPNRRLMHDRLGAAMGHASFHALMLIDLDNFKNLNDVQGHARGDQLLQAVAGRLVGRVRREDTVARMGGDEFALLLLGMGDNEEQARMRAAAFGETVRHALCQRFDLDGHQYAGTPSVGITLFCGAEFSADELTKRADTAMYQVKANGRNGVRFFDPAMQAALTARLALEQDLQRAVQARQLVLHFQPQVDANGCVTGAEVLLRWNHPQRGMVPPGEFIAMAETSGAILEIGHWVLETACAQLAAWAHDNATRHLTLAVNVSACQFNQPGFAAGVVAVLAASRADPRLLKLELTEGSLLDNSEAMTATMRALKRVGVSFSLDDFGTGYSSLSYLKRLPLDQLKIDQTFVRDLLTDSSDMAIVRTIVALGHSLEMHVIAEGVETEAQRACLASAGCHAYQGYLFGRPLPLLQFEAALRASSEALAAGSS